MGAVDVQRAIRSMTVPRPVRHEPGKSAADRIEEEPAAVSALPAAGDCPEFEAAECDECEALARETMVRLRPILRIKPQPLKLVLELLEVEFDLKHGCAERLFWLAHERGYLALHEGCVSLGEMPQGK
jgi:hypothetical protein